MDGAQQISVAYGLCATGYRRIGPPISPTTADARRVSLIMSVRDHTIFGAGTFFRRAIRIKAASAPARRKATSATPACCRHTVDQHTHSRPASRAVTSTTVSVISYATSVIRMSEVSPSERVARGSRAGRRGAALRGSCATTNRLRVGNVCGRALVEALARDPRATTGYELSKGILLWSDETPAGLSEEGAWVVIRLQAFRSMIYCPSHWQTEATAEWFERCRQDWNAAVASGLRWIGWSARRLAGHSFRRLSG